MESKASNRRTMAVNRMKADLEIPRADAQKLAAYHYFLTRWVPEYLPAANTLK